MKNLKAAVKALHKYLGTLMSFLFLVWCLTGFVLLFVGFPHASRQERYINLKPLSDSSLEKVLSFTSPYPKGLSLDMCNGLPVYRIKKGKKLQSVVDATTMIPIDSFSVEACKAIAFKFLKGDVDKVEKVNKLDTWIPWSYYKPLLPFYKFYYNDEAHSVVYVSSVIGSVVQETTRHTRWMARIGAIPHWVYFKQIKSNDALYKTLITILGLVGFLACFSGLVLGVIRMKRNSDGRICAWSVFKKRMYKYHHVFGLLVGLFLSLYVLSGVFYATGVPSWLVANRDGKSVYSQWNKEVNVASVSVSSFYKQLPDREELRQISWGETMGQAIVRAYYANYKIASVYTIDENEKLSPFSCDSNAILCLAKRYFPQDQISVEGQDTYDYYYEENGMYYHPLPVYKLNLNNVFKDALYIDPNTGKAVEYLNKNKIAKRILTKTFHKMELPMLYKYNTLRILFSILILMMCTVVSFTSLVLGVRFLKCTLRR